MIQNPATAGTQAEAEIQKSGVRISPDAPVPLATTLNTLWPPRPRAASTSSTKLHGSRPKPEHPAWPTATHPAGMPNILNRIGAMARRVVASSTGRTLDDALGRWLDHVDARALVRPGTRDAYGVAARHLRRIAGAWPVDGWTESNTLAVRDALGPRPALVKRVLWVLHGVLSREGVDIDLRGLLPRSEPREVSLTREQAAAFIVAARARLDVLVSGSDRNGVACALLALLTGARVSELCNARREDVTIWRREDGRIVGTLRVPASRSKSKRARTVPLSTAAAELVAGLLAEHESPWMLPSGRLAGRPLGRITANRQFRQLAEDSGLTGVRLHDLRHTFASLAVQCGRSLYDVQRALGHSSAWMTERYAHLRPEHLIAVADAVAGEIGGGR